MTQAKQDSASAITALDLGTIIPRGQHCEWCIFRSVANPPAMSFCLLFKEELDNTLVKFGQPQEKCNNCYLLFANGGKGTSQIEPYACNLQIESVKRNPSAEGR